MDVYTYHERSKHRFSGFARGPQTIDWDAQPDVFRRFEGAPLIMLPLLADQFHLPFSALFETAPITSHALTLASVSLLLEMSLALSAWKQYGGSRWSLRCNPSSGNLRPTETYLIATGFKDLTDGVYHYRADQHALEQRCTFATSVDSSSSLSPRLSIAFSSVHWREAWKYGERAFRYCQHDVGHAMAALSYAAATLDWKLTPTLQVSDNALAQLLGINRNDDYERAEHEYADLLIAVNHESLVAALPHLLQRAQHGQWNGKANVLDRKHLYEWPVIDEISVACQRPANNEEQLTTQPSTHSSPPLPLTWQETAADVFRRRRSAQAFDGQTAMQCTDFFRTLDHLIPRAHTPPWHAVPWQARVHLILFVHRVEGLSPGLYALPRHDQGLHLMQEHLRKEFLWQKIETAPSPLPLYHLLTARTGRSIATLSCQQAIAADGAFSVAMLAEFDAHINTTPWRYRELFWEAGIVGHTLYLEAEASGLRGTGIGCYFDDEVHELLGITGTTLQSLYHFTVGAPLLDARMISLPPYGNRHAPKPL